MCGVYAEVGGVYAEVDVVCGGCGGCARVRVYVNELASGRSDVAVCFGRSFNAWP